MDIRIIVPLQWSSSFRKDLFNALHKLGYTWSSGKSLLTHIPSSAINTQYIAIYVSENICKFSSNLGLVDGPSSNVGMNYITYYKDVPKILHVLSFFKKYLESNPPEHEVIDFLNNHYELRKLILL